MDLFQNLILVCNHDSNMNLKQTGPTVVDCYPPVNSLDIFKDIAHLCLPFLNEHGTTEYMSNEEILSQPSFFVNEGRLGNTPIHLCCLRFDLLIGCNEGSNLLWSAIRKTTYKKSASTHTHYCICMITRLPIFSFAKTILSYIFNCYCGVPSLPHCPYSPYSVLSLPYNITVDPACSINRFVDQLKKMKNVDLCNSYELKMKKVYFVIPANNSTIYSPCDDLALFAVFSSLSIETITLILKCLLCDGNVALFSTDTSLLSLNMEGLLLLLFPFKWRFCFYPVIPPDVKPTTPYFIGIEKNNAGKKSHERLQGPCLMVDVDKDQCICPPRMSIASSKNYPAESIKRINSYLRGILPTMVFSEEMSQHVKSVYKEEVDRWKEISYKNVFDMKGNGEPYILDILSSLTPFNLKSQYEVQDWADKGRAAILGFIFDFLGDYDTYITLEKNGASLQKKEYLEYRCCNDLLLMADILKSITFLKHIDRISRPKADWYSLVLRVKRKYLKSHDINDIYSAMKRTASFKPDYVVDATGVRDPYAHCVAFDIPLFRNDLIGVRKQKSYSIISASSIMVDDSDDSDGFYGSSSSKS